MDILNPPQSYINWRCATHDWERDPDSSPDEFNRIRKAFYKEFPDTEEEIKQFCNWLVDARQSGGLPVEQIEVRSSGGRATKAMIYDIEYWRERGHIKRRKVYMGNQDQFSGQSEIVVKKDQKMRAAGDYQDEVPF